MVWEVFYPGGSSSERFTLQWVADHWHRDKTTRATDFYSLEELIIHSYQARIIAILKPWVQKENRKVRLHDLQALGDYLASLSTHQWNRALHWLDLRMRHQRTTESSLNNHWNNHICFCKVIEAYLTLCYTIKWSDVGLLRNAMREIAIIL